MSRSFPLRCKGDFYDWDYTVALCSHCVLLQRAGPWVRYKAPCFCPLFQIRSRCQMFYCFLLHLFPRPSECQQNALHHHPPTKQQNSWFRGAFMSTYSDVCHEDCENISPEKLWNSQPLSLALKTSANSSILVWISRPSSTEIPSTNHNSMQLYWAPAELCRITN